MTLAGSEVVVTRPEGADGPLSTLLRERGATVVYWPTFRIEPPEDVEPLRAAARELERYDWVVFSSARAVEPLVALRPSLPDGRPRVAAVGSRTAEVLSGAGWPIHLTAEPARGSVLVDAMAGHDCDGARVLFPCSSIARATIPDGLAALGAFVDRVVAYRTTSAPLDREACLERIAAGRIAAVTFASPSAVHGLYEALGEPAFRRLFDCARPVAIGPTTARALDHLDCPRTTLATESTLPALAHATETALTP